MVPLVTAAAAGGLLLLVFGVRANGLVVWWGGVVFLVELVALVARFLLAAYPKGAEGDGASDKEGFFFLDEG